MNDNSYSRLTSSLSTEELLNPPDSRPAQSWLLAYIDVFVLIVMLLVTLVALSTFQQPPSPEEKINATEKQTIIAEHTEDLNQEALKKPAEEKNEQINEEEIEQQLNKQLEQLGLEDSVNMKVTLGYAQLEIQDNILYESSEAKLTDSGRSVLKRLTPLLQPSFGLIYIEGHTDDRPINTAKFPSNWELGAARATSVLHFLASQQIEVARMRAVTYADTQPVADNKTDEGRQKNRRVKIVIKVSDKID